MKKVDLCPRTLGNQVLILSPLNPLSISKFSPNTYRLFERKRSCCRLCWIIVEHGVFNIFFPGGTHFKIYAEAEIDVFCVPCAESDYVPVAHTKSWWVRPQDFHCYRKTDWNLCLTRAWKHLWILKCLFSKSYITTFMRQGSYCGILFKRTTSLSSCFYDTANHLVIVLIITSLQWK